MKFKVWNNYKEQFVDLNDFKMNFAITNEGKLIQINEFGDSWESEKYFIPIHYTGQTDKNGVEIYEGDILESSNDDPKYDIWEQSDSGLTCVIIPEKRFEPLKYSNWHPENDILEDSIFRLDLFVSVIGNKFENPKLMES